MKSKFIFTLTAALMAATLGLYGCDSGNGGGGSGGGSSSGGSVAPPAEPAATADAAVTAVTLALADNRPEVAWDALPASYQKDVTGLVHEFAGKMDADIWNKSFALLGKVAQLAKDKKEFMLGSAMTKDNPAFDAAKADAGWDETVAFFTTLTNNDAADLNKLKTLDIRQFLGTTGADLMKQARAMAQMNPAEGQEVDKQIAKLKQTKATVVSEDGDNVVVKMEVPGEPAEEVEFTKVEGKWIPKMMADEWADSIAEAKEGLAAMSGEELAKRKPQIMQLLTTVDTVLDQVAAAQTQEQFDQSLQAGVAMMAMVLFQGGAGGGPGGGIPAPPPNN